MKIRQWRFPDDLLYDERHQWLRWRDGAVRVGLTDFAQDTRGEVLYLQLPEVGKAVRAGDPLASIETGKWVGWIYAPCSGTVTAVNGALAADPGAIHTDPYGEGWVCEIAPLPSEPVCALEGEAFRRWMEREAARYLLEEEAPGEEPPPPCDVR
ncbi:MAG: glycine cleavage system protein GcvH [Deferrisomatales bacterium]